MFFYKFSHDFRINELESKIESVANMYLNDTVPTSTDDKSINNYATTLGFYFNIKRGTHNAVLASSGNVHRVIINFIEKFQYPNPRSRSTPPDGFKHDIIFAPLRTVLKLLYIMTVSEGERAYITTDEIREFLFYNKNVAKNKNYNLVQIYNNIIEYRNSDIIPDTIAPEEEREWKDGDREIRDMLKILLYSGWVDETDNGFVLKYDNVSHNELKHFHTIISNNEFWDPNGSKPYEDYMDIEPDIYKTIMNEAKDNVHRNRIVFGAPGTGKSYLLNVNMEEILPLDEYGKPNENNYERVTFYPSYTYAQFVGSYRPKPKIVVEVKGENKIEREIVTYEFVPGPFIRMLVKALKSENSYAPQNYLLIIEELNRANAASVFGDVFQLLDRKPDGYSQYPIETSEALRQYLISELKEEYDKIYLPSNFYIWASMNSADQGVNPIDTAFKRRWDFNYIDIDNGEHSAAYLDKPVRIGQLLTTWNRLRKEINRVLSTPAFNISEDKLLGPFFLAENAFITTVEESSEDYYFGNDSSNSNFSEVFKNKVLMYLFEDAVKARRNLLFESNSFSQLCKNFDKNGISVIKGLDHKNFVITEDELDQEVGFDLKVAEYGDQEESL